MKTYAGNLSPINKLIHPIFSAAIGAAGTENLGAPKTFPIINPATDTNYRYSPIKTEQTKTLFELFAGLEYTLWPQWQMQAGISYGQTGIFKAKGNLRQSLDASNIDFYQYYFNSRAKELLVQMKLSHVFRDTFYPYALFGIGTAFNKAYNFQTNVPITLTFTRTYQDNTTTSFAYQFGAGFDALIAKQTKLGVVYRYANLGAIKLGDSMINRSTVYGTLSQSRLYANELLLQLTYIL